MSTQSIKPRTVPWWLMAGILLFPPLFAWLTLDGYSKTVRKAAFTWLLLWAIWYGLKDTTPSASAPSKPLAVAEVASPVSDSMPSADKQTPQVQASAPAPEIDIQAERAMARETIAAIQGRLAKSREKLKSYYANDSIVQRASSDLIDLASIIASRGASTFKEDQQIAANAKKVADDLTKQRRELLASSLENSLMASGMNISVRAEGTSRDRLSFTYALMTKLVVYKFQNERGFPDTARSFGFKKIIYSDGHDQGDTWTVDL